MNKAFFPALIGVMMLVAAIILVFAWEQHVRKERRKRFAHRQELSLEEIYRRYFAAESLPKERVIETWQRLAQHLEIPPGKLRPSDTFAEDLAPPKGWEFDDELYVILDELEKDLKKGNFQIDPNSIQTVGDYVRFYAKRTWKEGNKR